MSFIKESKNAYKQVQENHIAIAMGKMLDDEGSMILNQLEELERAIEMIRTYIGADYEKQLPAWVQSKVTLGSDYISTVGNYLSSKNEKVTEQAIKEEFDLEETSLAAIHKMKEDGKTTEEIAKELKLNAGLVKKILGEEVELKEFTDAMLAALKKEYEPLKGKTITTAQYQQLKNILFKLQDADLEKLQKQNIPFASTGAGSILRARKSPVKITSVKVPGLEGMAEEKIPQGYLDYLRTIVYKKVDFYEIPPKHIIQHWRDEPHKDRFTGKIIDYKEEVDMSKVTKYKMISIKGDQKEITIDRKDLEKHLKLGYVIKEPLTEEVELQEKPSIKQYVVFHSDSSPTKHKEFKAYDETELNKQIGEFLKQNPGYKVYGKSPSQSIKESPIQSVTEEPKNPYAIGMAEETLPVMSGSDSLGYNVKYKVKKSDQMISVFWSKEKNLAQKFLDDIKKTGGNGIITAKEEIELQEKPKVKKQKDQTNNIPQNIEPAAAGGANTQIGLSMGEETFKDNIVNKLVKPVQDYNKKAAEIKTIDMTDGSAHVRFPKDDTRAMEFYKSKGYKVTTKYEEVEIQEEPKLNQKNLDKFHTSLDKLVHKTFGSSSDEKKKQEPKKEEVKEPTGNLKDACWTGYVAVGTKMKNGKRVPNCVPKSEAYKGAKAIVENAFKKLKEKK